MRQATICSCALVIGVVLTAQVAQAQSLSQAVSMAIDNSARVGRAEAGVALSYEERTGTAAQGRMRVQVDGTGARRTEYGEQRGFAGTINSTALNTNRNTVGVTVSQSIYTGGRLREALNAADSRIESAIYRSAAAEILATRNAASAYADVLRAQIVAGIVGQGTRDLSEDVRGAQARFDAGEVSITDVAQSKARFSGAISQSSRAQADLETARATFERFVGQPPANLDANLPEVDLPTSMTTYLDMVVSQNPEILAARADYEAANSATRLAATQRNPRVSLEASYEHRWNETFRGSNSYVGQIGTRVTLPLWDGGQTSSNIRQAAARASSARFQMQDVIEEVRSNAQRAWADYRSSLEVVRALESQVEAASLARTGAQEELRFGLRSTIEALNQEQELRSARLALATAKRDLYVDMVDLLSLMGRNPLGQPAKQLDPIRRSAVPPPSIPKPLPIEAPLVTVLEFLEARDRPVSEVFYGLNRSLEPTRVIGPIP